MGNIDDLLSKDTKKIKERKTIGRPKKSNKATNKITCYLTDEDFKKIQEKAKEELNLSAYLKKMILKDIE